MQWARSDGRIIRPHVYRKAPGLSVWGWCRDEYGWLWIDFGPFVFTTHP